MPGALKYVLKPARGAALLVGMAPKPYPTDLTDAQWERVRRHLPPPKSGTRKGGRPATDDRAIVNAVVYHVRAGGAWRLAPSRTGSPAVQACRSGWASRVHQHSSWNPGTPSDRRAASAISRSRNFFSSRTRGPGW